MFVNEYLRRKGYDQVDIEYVNEYSCGNADNQAALPEEIGSVYRPKRAKNPIDKFAR